MENLATNYELVNIDGGTTLTILEKNSNQHIGKYSSVTKANKVLTNLVNGLAFEGWTPPFFTINYEKNRGKA